MTIYFTQSKTFINHRAPVVPFHDDVRAEQAAVGVVSVIVTKISKVICHKRSVPKGFALGKGSIGKKMERVKGIEPS